MKKIIEVVLKKALERFLEILLNALERMVNIDLNDDGKIGGQETTEEET